MICACLQRSEVSGRGGVSFYIASWTNFGRALGKLLYTGVLNSNGASGGDSILIEWYRSVIYRGHR